MRDWGTKCQQDRSKYVVIDRSIVWIYDINNFCGQSLFS